MTNIEPNIWCTPYILGEAHGCPSSRHECSHGGASWKWRFHRKEQKKFWTAVAHLERPFWGLFSLSDSPYLFSLDCFSIQGDFLSHDPPPGRNFQFLPPWKFGFDGSEAGCFRLGKRSPWESCLPAQTLLHSQLFRLSLKDPHPSEKENQIWRSWFSTERPSKHIQYCFSKDRSSKVFLCPPSPKINIYHLV